MARKLPHPRRSGAQLLRGRIPYETHQDKNKTSSEQNHRWERCRKTGRHTSDSWTKQVQAVRLCCNCQPINWCLPLQAQRLLDLSCRECAHVFWIFCSSCLPGSICQASGDRWVLCSIPALHIRSSRYVCTSRNGFGRQHQMDQTQDPVFFQLRCDI